MAYADISDVQDRMLRDMSEDESIVCATMLEDAAKRIDATRTNADANIKKVVSCRMVIRALGDGSGSTGFPIGSTQGSLSGLVYSQSWTVGGGTTGELYLSKEERRLLGLGNAIGTHSPVEGLIGSDIC